MNVCKVLAYALSATLFLGLSSCSLLGIMADEKLHTETTSGEDGGIFEIVGEVLDKKTLEYARKVKKDRHAQALERVREEAYEEAKAQERSNDNVACEEVDASQVCTLKEGCWCENTNE